MSTSTMLASFLRFFLSNERVRLSRAEVATDSDGGVESTLLTGPGLLLARSGSESTQTRQVEKLVSTSIAHTQFLKRTIHKSMYMYLNYCTHTTQLYNDKPAKLTRYNFANKLKSECFEFRVVIMWTLAFNHTNFEPKTMRTCMYQNASCKGNIVRV